MKSLKKSFQKISDFEIIDFYYSFNQFFQMFTVFLLKKLNKGNYREVRCDESYYCHYEHSEVIPEIDPVISFLRNDRMFINSGAVAQL